MASESIIASKRLMSMGYRGTHPDGWVICEREPQTDWFRARTTKGPRWARKDRFGWTVTEVLPMDVVRARLRAERAKVSG